MYCIDGYNYIIYSYTNKYSNDWHIIVVFFFLMNCIQGYNYIVYSYTNKYSDDWHIIAFLLMCCIEGYNYIVYSYTDKYCDDWIFFFFFFCDFYFIFFLMYLNPLGFSPLWFEHRSGHMWESQVLLTDGQVIFPRVLRFRPPLMNDLLDISEILLKGP